ncbi:conserved protein of unknown function [Rhodovastum atsumiense]|uniref:Uncharacterized protein n=1 Tax=Rhodovastum atsumiense TaxID=504468 RepID=A0A5M6IRF4_9PROT|nr:hypothetical protein [Rhodovastum atsumiense]KAA5610055.1 hypothetical protein F1189_21370 [Rhodovastum atsumiense]CAH2602949.1 conserved protein of unknown function [Rhodovastum atsumiense]
MMENGLHFADSMDSAPVSETALERAARYRWTAEYIQDPSLSPYLMRVAEEYQKQAANGVSLREPEPVF